MYLFLLLSWILHVSAIPKASMFSMKEDLLEQAGNFMGPKGPGHMKTSPDDLLSKDKQELKRDPAVGFYDYDTHNDDGLAAEPRQGEPSREFNRVKRMAKHHHHVKAGERRKTPGASSTRAPEDAENKGKQKDDKIDGRRRGGKRRSRKGRHRKKGFLKKGGMHMREPQASYEIDDPVTLYGDPGKSEESPSSGDNTYWKDPARAPPVRFVEMPKDLYQAHLRPGVIFRIHMSEAILKMQYRGYGEDRDESVIEADVEYLRLTRKVISDEITKFEDLRWLTSWFSNRSDLIKEHTCSQRYYTVGVPPTAFTHSEEFMKRSCLFDSVFVDHIPYVIGDDGSLMASVAPPVLHCDAATCTSVPFVDSIMFADKLPRTNVRTLTRCQATCRARCKNDPDCLKRCSDKCLRA